MLNVPIQIRAVTLLIRFHRLIWIFTSVATILLEEELKFIEKVRTPLLLKEKYFRLLINRAKFGSCIKKLLFKINDITVFC